MNLSPKGFIELASYEALSHQLYLDSVNVRTIGIGSTISEIPDINHWSWDKTLTTEECVDLYRMSLGKYIDAVNKALTVEVEQYQFDALVSITYNIGIGGMRGSTFMKRVNAGNSAESVASGMRTWNRGGGWVIKGLVNRRQYESDLYVHGKYRNNGTVTLIKVNPNTHKPIYSGSIDIRDYIPQLY